MAAIYEGKGTTLTAGTSTGFTILKTAVTPPEISVGEIDVTTLANTAWKTKKPALLKEAGVLKFKGIYDPALTVPYGVNEAWTLTIPEGGGVQVFYGFLSKFAPGEIAEGNMVECDGEITISNLNVAVETGPAYTAS
jgi:hypothetical protein